MPIMDKIEKLDKLKSSTICCNICGKTTIKVVSSIIVPLLIGVATVLISIIQLQIASKQRAQDLQIATERREQDLHVADTLQQDLVLAAYIEQMSRLMLTPNFTINDALVANICRAKTLTAIRQVNSKRKTHLIKFLYAARMIRHDQPHIRLYDAELDNIDLSKTNYLDGKYRSDLSELSFKQTSLNNASFANQLIINSTFEDASLIEANFTGCRISSTSFVGAVLRYGNFDNATSKEYINFKSADLFGSIISDDMLLNAISIENAILPNGTRGIQRNLLINGDAESPDCKTNTSMPSSWQIEQIAGNVSLIVTSYVATINVIQPINSTISRGQCFYSARGREGKIMMRQEIFFTSATDMPIIHGNIALLLKLFCAPIGIISEKQGFAQLDVQQFDLNGMLLHSYTKGKIQLG